MDFAELLIAYFDFLLRFLRAEPATDLAALLYRPRRTLLAILATRFDVRILFNRFTPLSKVKI